MIPAAFDYQRPANLEEALRILAEGREGTRVINGGQSLLPLLKLRLSDCDRLVDIARLPELQGVRPGADGGLVIGAAVTYRTVLDSPLVAERLPLLLEVIADIGDVQVRNRGTLGGSVAHADPGGDMPAVILALGGTIVLRSLTSKREVPAADFFQSAFTTVIASDELLVGLRLPPVPAGAGTAYRQIMQPASGYSMVGVAAVVAVSDGEVSHVQIGITGVGDVAYRAYAVEAALLGTDGGAAALAAAATHATAGQDVSGDIHGDAEYRTAMAEVITRRALEAAIAKAD
jgi:aerobic carbon-monoxide dehydrogenase medium subunit